MNGFFSDVIKLRIPLFSAQKRSDGAPIPRSLPRLRHILHMATQTYSIA